MKKIIYSLIIIFLIIQILLVSSIGYASKDKVLSNNLDVNNPINIPKEKKIPNLICIDNDGEDFYFKGFVNLTKGNNTELFNDECNDNVLIENICINNVRETLEYGCEYGCLDGKCLTCEDINCTQIEDVEEPIEECEDGTLLNECNQDGFKCVDLMLIEDESCIQDSPPINLIDINEVGETKYIYSNSQLVAREINDKIYYNINDYQNSLRLVLDENWILLNEYNYYPFGKTIDENNGGEYTSKEFDSELGLYYYGARYYDPEIGRFTQVDPLDTSTSPYESFNSNPNRYIDPDGRKVVELLSPIWLEKNTDFMNYLREQPYYKILDKDPTFIVKLRHPNPNEFIYYENDPTRASTKPFTDKNDKTLYGGVEIILRDQTFNDKNFYDIYDKDVGDLFWKKVLRHEMEGHALQFYEIRNKNYWNTETLLINHIEVYKDDMIFINNEAKKLTGSTINEIKSKKDRTKFETSIIHLYDSSELMKTKYENDLNKYLNYKKSRKTN